MNVWTKIVWTKIVWTLLNGWCFLSVPLSIIFVVMADQLGWKIFLSKGVNETTALFLIGSTFVFCCVKLAKYKSSLLVILTFLSFGLFCREIHFFGTNTYMYFTLFATLIWSWFWWGRLAFVLKDNRFVILFIATLFTYLASQLIARRVFRGCWSGEQQYHVPVEELMENVAHIMLFISCTIVKPKPHLTSNISAYPDV